uniref:Uncharacterized protein n=1 Tax=Rhizophora mucronata TaxID=61149 RepID=A0A2P2IH01_RHIMU
MISLYDLWNGKGTLCPISLWCFSTSSRLLSIMMISMFMHLNIHQELSASHILSCS